jgi:hypothetical protein
MTYGTVHEPLLATVAAGRKPGQVVAFLDGQLCFFERGTPTPRIGETVEVMIVRPIHPRADLHGCPVVQFDRLVGLEIRIVDRTRHVLVATDGFDRSGSGCATSAFGCPTDGTRVLTRADVYRGVGRDAKRLRDAFTLTPGRSGVVFADNVAPAFHGREWASTTPTNVWVDLDQRTGLAQRRSRVPGDSPTVRVAGLTRVADLECAALVRTGHAFRKAA